jgi:ankyrin repeat protein
LHGAAEKGYKERVEALLNRLKDQQQNFEDLILGEDNFGNTPLDCAVENNRQVVIYALVSTLNDNINVIYEFFLYHNNFDEVNISRSSKRTTDLLHS